MGSVVRRGTKDRSRFYVRYVDADGVRRMRLAKGATRREHAVALLNTIERNVLEGRVGVPQPAEPDPAADRRRTITLKEIGEKFTTEFKGARIKDLKVYRMESKSTLTRVYPRLGDRAAASINQLDVESLRDALTDDDYAPQTVSNTINLVSKIFGWALKQGHIDCSNPTKGVEKPRSEMSEPIDSSKFLQRAEASQLLAYVDAVAIPGVASEETLIARPMVWTALLTGMRRGELAGLRWSSIDFDRRQIEVSRSYAGKTKSGKVRHVPLHRDLAPILRAWKPLCPKSADDLVFPVKGRMARSDETLGLADLMDGAGVHRPPKVWHGMRHSYASHFVMCGGSIVALQRLLGHSSVTTTMRYSHLAPDHMTSEVDKISFAPTLAGVTPIMSAVG